MTRALDVYFCDTKAGVLSRLDDGLLTFAYDSAYLLDQRPRAISFSMPLQEKPFGDQVVRPFFSGLLPDEGARQRLAGALGLSSGNAFGLLEIIGVAWHLTVRMRPFRQVMALNLRFFGAIFGT